MTGETGRAFNKLRVKRALTAAFITGWFVLFQAPWASANVRIKDIANFEGFRANQLIGYGIVVGLNGTGDGTRAEFTKQILSNMLYKLGVTISPSAIRVKNTATVMVTAELPPFAKAGTRLDVLVSSLGDAKSLQGGTLLLTPLRAPNREIYAVGQGPVSVGGFGAGGAGASVQQNHLTVGTVINGGLVEKDLPLSIAHARKVRLNLYKADFTTAYRMAERINEHFGSAVAKPIDASAVSVDVPERDQADVVEFLYQVENVNVRPDAKAVVILNERTGTVVMGENVRVSTVAVAHGNLNIVIRETPEVSQPEPFSERGRTVVVPRTDVYVNEEENKLLLLPEGVTIGEVVRALNAIGVSPRDLISVLMAIKEAGALQADLRLL
ncbi:MAG: flagellar basal body P-ring protein FlgI [Deltaproteobacteria bacterium]|nr:flagellar basal body P-ring protein FlgI [Deltaproteobacteria bacterium]